MSQTQTEYVIRTEGMYNSYGLGEVISNGITLFRAGKYNLTEDELQIELNKIKKAVIRK